MAQSPDAAPTGAETAPADGPPPGEAQQGGAGNLFPLLIIAWVAIFYFFFMRPKQRKEKDRQRKMGEIKKGDKVVSIGGIHGTVIQVDEKTLTLRTDEKTGATLKLERAAIHDVPGKDGEAKDGSAS
ncbi:MAG: preprotein translocase subunit YajC [Planctomycetota bacterium]